MAAQYLNTSDSGELRTTTTTTTTTTKTTTYSRHLTKKAFKKKSNETFSADCFNSNCTFGRPLIRSMYKLFQNVDFLG